MSDERIVEAVDPADAFGALADDTRVDVRKTSLWQFPAVDTNNAWIRQE